MRSTCKDTCKSESDNITCVLLVVRFLRYDLQRRIQTESSPQDSAYRMTFISLG